MAVINPQVNKTKDYNAKFKSISIDNTKSDQFLQDQGVRVKVYKSFLCPNVKQIDDGLHQLECSLCRRGFVDKDPIETWSYIQSQAINKVFGKDGSFDDSHAAATFISGVELNYFSKIELVDFTSTFFERIQRQEGDIDRLKYSAHAVNYLLDQHGREWQSGQHFELSTTGDIKWVSFDRPDKATIYTVHYSYPVTFRAIQALHINRFGQSNFKNENRQMVEFQQQWIIKRDFLLDRTDVDNSPLSPNQIFNDKTDPE